MKKLTAEVHFTTEELQEVIDMVEAAWNDGFEGEALNSVFEKSRQAINSLEQQESEGATNE